MSKETKKMKNKEKEISIEIKNNFRNVVSDLRVIIDGSGYPAAIISYYPFVSSCSEIKMNDIEHRLIGNGLTKEEALKDLLSNVKKMKACN